MNEIYWLQRLGNIGFCFNVGFWTCVIIAAVITIVSFFLFCVGEFDDGGEFDDSDLKKAGRYLKKFAMVFAFFTTGAIITPTKKDLIAIYGLGGVIDYIKSNDKAKQLPDKCIDALTRYVDSIEKNNKDNNNE